MGGRKSNKRIGHAYVCVKMEQDVCTGVNVVPSYLMSGLNVCVLYELVQRTQRRETTVNGNDLCRQISDTSGQQRCMCVNLTLL